MEEEVVKNYHTAILKLCDRFFNKAIKIPVEKYDWTDNAAIWYTYFAKEATKVEDKMPVELNSKEVNAFLHQVQGLGMEEFGKLKLRIEEYMANSR